MTKTTSALFTGLLFMTMPLALAAPEGVLPQSPPVPQDNPMSSAKIQLGRQLYFDPRLSGDGTISCNTCHNVMNSTGTDASPVSTGIHGKKGGRNSPTVWNAAFWSVQFWDGRAPSLEEQAKGPIVNPIEMGMKDHGLVMERVKKIPGYIAQFEKVFGKNALTIDNLAKAIAAYERTLITPHSPYDRYLMGNTGALSASAVRGMKLVQTVGCQTCHMGPHFNGPVMPMGQGFYQKFPLVPGSEYEAKYNLATDKGRYEATQKDSDKNMWRIPSWRNVADTAPYFHNGSVATLDEAVRVMAKTQLGKTLSEAEVGDIVAFLKSLSGRKPIEKTKPELPADPKS